MRKFLVAIVLMQMATSAAYSQGQSNVDGSDALSDLKDDFLTDQRASDLNGDGLVDFLDLGLLQGRLAAAKASNALGGAQGGNVLFFSHLGQLEPLYQISVVNQDQLFLDLNMSFNDETVGGGIDLVFDSAVLALVEVVFDAGLGDDPEFRCPTDPAAANPVDCSLSGPDFVSFGGFFPITGDRRVATLEFAAIATGTSAIDFDIALEFSDAVGQPLEVPEPAFGWAGVLATLAVLSRSSRTV